MVKISEWNDFDRRHNPLPDGTISPIIHKVDQHCGLSECGKTTHKDNRSATWKGVNCKECLKVRKPRGKKRY